MWQAEGLFRASSVTTTPLQGWQLAGSLQEVRKAPTSSQKVFCTHPFFSQQ